MKQHWEFHDFKGAYFRATRFDFFPHTKIFWRPPNGPEKAEELPDGPWSLSDRLWEHYTPTKVGIVVADRPHN